MASSRSWRIAVVNSDPRFLNMVEEVLEESGPYDVSIHKDTETSLEDLRAISPDLLIIDVLAEELPNGWELAVVAGADRDLGDVPIIVTTPETAAARHRVGELREVANVRVVGKPFELDALRSNVEEALGTGPSANSHHRVEG